MSSDGDPERTYGERGSVRLDVFEIRGNDLYIYDFKAGGATLSRPRINEIVSRANHGGAPRAFDRIVIIEVKL